MCFVDVVVVLAGRSEEEEKEEVEYEVMLHEE